MLDSFITDVKYSEIIFTLNASVNEELVGEVTRVMSSLSLYSRDCVATTNNRYTKHQATLA